MFPLSLKKNIRELDRQISLLENECEHLDSEKAEAAPPGKANPKVMVPEMPNKPFVTGPCASASSYSSRMLVVSPIVPKIYSASCAHFRTISEKFPKPKTPKKHGFCNSKSLEKTENYSEVPQVEKQGEFSNSEVKVGTSFRESKNFETEPKMNVLKSREIRKSCKRSISCIKEVTESSDENGFLQDYACDSKPKKNLVETSENYGSHLVENSTEETQKRNKKNTSKTESIRTERNQNNFRVKSSSDEERSKGTHSEELENKPFGTSAEYERPLTPRKRSSSKRRLRSVRTKRNNPKDVLLDVNISRVLHEKETQCMILDGEKEKAEILTVLCESLRTLYMLIGEHNMKSPREKINSVLNEMKNALMKLSKINSLNHEKNPLNAVSSLKENPIKPFECEEIANLKKTLFGVTKFCKDLETEKSALAEELLEKTRTLAIYKNKEKEYLTMISNLKFTLKKYKQETEDKSFAKRDFEILKTKLQEETKVIEALRKSHEKMQELVEKYVLENDKLKAKVKISKLESEKFYVLLAGKEVEIKKYKKDIESFQRQITEQLSLLRSRATDNEVEHALKTISHQTNSLQTEAESNMSDTTTDKGNFKTLVLKSMETTSMSSLEVKSECANNKKTLPITFKKEESPRKLKLCEEIKKTKDTETKSKDSESETNSDRRRGLQRVLSSSKNLRSSINELLEDIRRETPEKHWSSTRCGSSSLSTFITSSSEDVSERSEKNKN